MNDTIKKKGNFPIGVKERVTLIIIAVIFIAVAVAKPELFGADRFPEVMNSILLWTPLILTVSVGMMMIIITRNIDLSVGAIVAVSAMVAGILFRDFNIPIWLGFLVSMGVGYLCGAFNGFLISYLKIPAIIVTLGYDERIPRIDFHFCGWQADYRIRASQRAFRICNGRVENRELYHSVDRMDRGWNCSGILFYPEVYAFWPRGLCGWLQF